MEQPKTTTMRARQLHPLYDVQFVAERYNVSKRTVRRWIRSGRLRASKGPGTSWMVTEHELERQQGA